jgi:DHA1 family tetracycline resistance protein-like MFS transporter
MGNRFLTFLRSPLFPIFMIVFVDILGLGITIPVLPLFAKNDLGAPAWQITALTSVYFAAMLLAGPVLGRLSDRYGRRPVLIASQAGTFTALLLTGSAVGIFMIYIARLIDGLTGGNISVAQAYLSDITDEKNRARGLGIVNAAFSAGFVFGPAFGSVLAAQFGPRVPFFAAAGMSLITILLSTFLLPESLPPEKRNREQALTLATPFTELLRLPQEMRRVPTMGLLLTISFGVNMGFFAFQTIYALWLEHTVLAGYSEQTVQYVIGGLLTAVGIVGILTQSVLVGPLVRRFGEKHLVIFGNAARGASFVLLSVLPAMGTAIGVVPLLSMGGGLALPSLIALLTYTALPQQRGRVIGLNQSAASLGNIFGPLISGYLFDHVGPHSAMGAAGIITLATVALGLRIYRMPIHRPVPSGAATVAHPQPPEAAEL